MATQTKTGTILVRTIPVLAAFLLAGCATQKELVPTGGSRADGTVHLSYEVGMFEKPVINWDAGKNAATQRCNAWGYSSAEPFGGQTSRCEAFNGYGNCIRSLVTVTYQCEGAPASSR
jgi:hypothetical protein